MNAAVVFLLVALVAFATASPLLLIPKLDFEEGDIEHTISLIKRVTDNDEFTLKDQQEFVERLTGMPLETVLKARSEEDMVFTISPIERVDEKSPLLLRDPREMAERLRGIPLETTTEK